MENKKPLLIVNDSSAITEETLNLAKSKGATIVIGAGPIGMTAQIIDMATRHNVEIILAEEGNLGRTIREVAVVDDKPLFVRNDFFIKGLGEDIPKLNIEQMAKPYLDKLNDLDMFELKQLLHDSIPNKLQLLKNLNLSEEQIDYFKNSPNERMEGEKQEDYKTRRMLNKLLIKFRGEY